MTIARRVIVTGRVQGVFFRSWTKEQADSLGLSGWVRNCADGSVEAYVEGEDMLVERLIARLRCGPPAANVGTIEVSEAQPRSMRGFELRH